MSVTARDPARQMAEVLRLHLTEGKGLRAISRETGLARKTVRRLLKAASGEREKAKPREHSSIVDPYVDDIRALLSECATIHAPAVLDRLREGLPGRNQHSARSLAPDAPPAQE